jgi:hypothetical protein
MIYHVDGLSMPREPMSEALGLDPLQDWRGSFFAIMRVVFRNLDRFFAPSGGFQMAYDVILVHMRPQAVYCLLNLLFRWTFQLRHGS